MTQRPTGITILAVLAIIGGILGILGGVTAFGLGGVVLSPAVMGLGGFSLILGIVDLVLGWGFWTLKPWAWMLGLILQILSVLQIVLGWIFNGFQVGGIISLAIAAIIIWYLYQPHVKQAFGRA